jgi:hypothetical protein
MGGVIIPGWVILFVVSEQEIHIISEGNLRGHREIAETNS